VPGYLAAEDKLKAAGIDEVIVVCINDAAVMDAWADDQKVGRDGKGSIINMLGDPHGALTDALGMRMTHPGPQAKFGQGRSKRYSALVVKGVFKIINIAEDLNDDPAGDDRPRIRWWRRCWRTWTTTSLSSRRSTHKVDDIGHVDRVFVMRQDIPQCGLQCPGRMLSSAAAAQAQNDGV